MRNWSRWAKNRQMAQDCSSAARPSFGWSHIPAHWAGTEVSDDLSHLNSRPCTLHHVAHILGIKCNALVPLLPAIAFAAPAHERHIYRSARPTGFLPGYHQPPNNSVPVYGSKGSIRGTSGYAPSYWYNGGWYDFGDPGFFRGRYNGGSFGPCWTWTPIGRMWNCG